MSKLTVSFFWAGILAMVPGARAALLADPAVDQYNCRMSTTMIGGGYQFTTNNILVEGAQVLTNLGINSYKFTLNSIGGGYVTLPSDITNLTLEARDVALTSAANGNSGVAGVSASGFQFHRGGPSAR